MDIVTTEVLRIANAIVSKSRHVTGIFFFHGTRWAINYVKVVREASLIMMRMNLKDLQRTCWQLSYSLALLAALSGAFDDD